MTLTMMESVTRDIYLSRRDNNFRSSMFIISNEDFFSLNICRQTKNDEVRRLRDHSICLKKHTQTFIERLFNTGCVKRERAQYLKIPKHQFFLFPIM